jgi:hypothetical protein
MSSKAPINRQAEVTPGLVGPDDYSIETLELITADQTINIKGVFAEFSYYEDIFRGSITGSVLINDAIGIIDRLGLNGSEYLHIVFKKTNQTRPIEKYFKVYRVGERILKNYNTEVYALHFCTDELFLSEQIKISKAYNGAKISDIVYNVLAKELKIEESKLIIADTFGMYDFIIPYKKPFEAVNWLATYAKSPDYIGSDFVFFHNVEGFNFLSLQSLFMRQPYSRYMFIPRNLGDQENTKELGNDIVGIKSYNILDTFDTLMATNMGAFANRVITVDPMLRRYKNVTFNYSDYFNNSETLNKFMLANNTKNRLNKYPYENYDSVLKVLTSNSEQKKAKGISDKPYAVANDVYIEDYVKNRTAQLALATYSRIKLALSGDPNLTIGMTVDLSLPSMRGSDGSGNASGEKDQYHSGKYLITAIRHIIDVNMRYETILEVSKDSFGSLLPDYNPSDNSKIISEANKK